VATIPNTRALTVGDGNTDQFNVDTQNDRIDLPNGTTINFWSDNYTTAAGKIANGVVSPAVSVTAVAIADAGTVATAGIGVSRLAPAAARTGLIMAVGTVDGQQVWVVNEATVEKTVQMAAAGTSNVADGINTIIPGKSARMFVWDSSVSLWFDTAQTINGTVNVAQSATAPVITNDSTITTNGVGSARVAPGGAVTGIILGAGQFAGQEVWVVNEATGANTVTMAAAATSFVADGASTVIAGLTAAKFVWNSVVSRWFRAA